MIIRFRLSLIIYRIIINKFYKKGERTIKKLDRKVKLNNEDVMIFNIFNKLKSIIIRSINMNLVSAKY